MTSAPGYQSITFEQTGPIARITLNRPEAANGMNDTLLRELADAAKRCDVPGIKAVVLTGEGRFFSAGGDLKAVAGSPERPGRYIKGIADDLHKAVATFARMDAVLITAVNGVAAGAGFSLAVSGDLVLAASSASFTMAYTRAGLSPDGGASYYLPRLVGIRRTQELMLTNRTLSAQEAADWGLVNEVVDGADLAARAGELATQIASGSSTSQSAVKKLLLSSFDNGLEVQLELEARLIGANADAPDGREGIDAFLTKRAPKFD
ncbi:enoyl-CoA hydratase/isomerase family protein [Mycolicibacterium komossense]|uniref:Enoyl-CoA hydratase/isomerase family protein n=1 Tax=Mycolicibacterium komossense TaxID=1779 RepID=A0ABT3C6A5_9MYCO|nr:enoyl-CoA hydratase-related protein [Mycolicibacterium komossense]MCV7225007.1 enoyl-CoA hydratase/isomerase family protein [Mycolicibacterium komossense]